MKKMALCLILLLVGVFAAPLMNSIHLTGQTAVGGAIKTGTFTGNFNMSAFDTCNVTLDTDNSALLTDGMGRWSHYFNTNVVSNEQLYVGYALNRSSDSYYESGCIRYSPVAYCEAWNPTNNYSLAAGKVIDFNDGGTPSTLKWNSLKQKLEVDDDFTVLGSAFVEGWFGIFADNWLYLDKVHTHGFKYSNANSRIESDVNLYTSGKFLGDGTGLDGVVVSDGIVGGQTIYGGDSSNGDLILRAKYGDTSPQITLVDGDRLDFESGSTHLFNIGTSDILRISAASTILKNDLYVDSSDIYLKPDQFIDFNEGGTAKTALYSSANNQFELNDSVYTSGNFELDQLKMIRWSGAEPNIVSDSLDNLVLSASKDGDVRVDLANGRFKIDNWGVQNSHMYLIDTARIYMDTAETKYIRYANTRFEFNDEVNINDVLSLVPRANSPSSPAMGDIYSDSTNGELCYYNGATWTGLVAGGTCA